MSIKLIVLAKKAEEIVGKYGNIKHITTSVGAGTGQSGLSPNHARVVIDMVDREFRLSQEEATDQSIIYYKNSNETMNAIRKEMVNTIVGATVKVDKQEEGPPVGPPVNVEISGDDYDVISQIAQNLKEKIKDVPGLVDLEDDYVKGLPEFRIQVDKVRAALLNLDTNLIGTMIKASVNGLKVGDYREGEDEYDITARLPYNMRESIQDVMSIRIPDYDGNAVPLTSVAKIVTTSGLGEIKHIDQKRVVAVSANVEEEKGYNSSQVLAEVAKIAETIDLPSGYAFNYTGENQEQEESQAFMTKSFMIAIFLIALILVTQFNSISSPFIILTSVILSLLGVFFGLIILHKPFGIIMTGMGVISLAGVVVNNAIVLIDYINLKRKVGLPTRVAIVKAGETRFRPVVLTAITTILGLIPMAVGISFDFKAFQWVIGSDSSQWWGPMAVAVIFGLAVATVLTLFVVPALYAFFDDMKILTQNVTQAIEKFFNSLKEKRRLKKEQKEKESQEEPTPLPSSSTIKNPEVS